MNQLESLCAPTTVNLEITAACNQSCSFCFDVRPEYSKSLRTELAQQQRVADRIGGAQRLLSVVDRLAAADVFEIRLFGGEFTVYKRWRDVVDRIRHHGLFLSFVSNGYALRSDAAKYLAASGIREAAISIHGTESVHDQIVGRPGAFARATKAIDALRCAGIDVSIAYTPTLPTLGALWAFVQEMRRSYGIIPVGVNRLFFDGRYGNLELRHYHELLTCIERCDRELGARIWLNDSLPRCVVPVRHWKYLTYCSQASTFAQVDFNGNLKSCPAVAVHLGNILERDLRELWGHAELQSIRRLHHLPLSCRICPIFCGGGCVASRGAMCSAPVADQFTPLKSEEGAVSAIARAAANFVRGLRFRFTDGPGTRAITRLPSLQPDTVLRPRELFLIRREPDGRSAAMFERAGLLVLSRPAAEVLRRIDGVRTAREIIEDCRGAGINCSLADLPFILEELPISIRESGQGGLQ